MAPKLKAPLSSTIPTPTSKILDGSESLHFPSMPALLGPSLFHVMGSESWPDTRTAIRSGVCAFFLYTSCVAFSFLNKPVLFLALFCAIYGRIGEGSKVPNDRTSLRPPKDDRHECKPPEMEHVPQRSHGGPRGHAKAPVPQLPQPEGATLDNPIVIKESEDEDKGKSYAPGGAGGESDHPGNESEDQEESVGVVEEDEERQNSITAGSTIARARSGLGTPRLKFNDRCPELEPAEDGPLPFSDEPDATSLFYNGLGMVNTRQKARDIRGLVEKIELDLTRFERQDHPVIYILQHREYKNLYKVGCTKNTTEVRINDSDPCIKRKAVKVHTSRRIRGARRAEKLIHKHMASRNLGLEMCEHCQTETQIKAHTEWFIGNLRDIKWCVDFWVDAVEESYDTNGVLKGDVLELLLLALWPGERAPGLREGSRDIRVHPDPRHRRTEATRRVSAGTTAAERESVSAGMTAAEVSYEERGLESREDSRRLRDHLNQTPSRPPRGTTMGRHPSVGSVSSGEEEETRPANKGRRLRGHSTSADGLLALPPKKLARRSGGGGRVQLKRAGTRSVSGEASARSPVQLEAPRTA